jgi:hypothetical protein
MASYDSTLLASAPAATKSQLQEGYTTDLLEKPTASPAHSRPDLHDGRDSTTATPNHQRDVERQQAFAAPAKVPWYRTTKGLIILAVAFVVIIAAAVGGGVGGSKKKKNNNDATVQGTGGGGASQGGAGAPAGNSTTAAASTTGTPSQGGGQTPSGTPTPTADPSQTTGSLPITFAPLPSIFSNVPPNPITTPVVPPGQAASG